MNCRKIVSYYHGQPEFCYKRAGHTGDCFKSPGHEMEDIFRRIIEASGCQIDKSTGKEDDIDKVDFWIHYKNKKIPIQFTISREAYPRKAIDAVQRKIVPIHFSEESLMEWERSGSRSIKEQVENTIHNEVIRVIERFVNIPNFHFAEPRQVLPVMN